MAKQTVASLTVALKKHHKVLLAMKKHIVSQDARIKVLEARLSIKK
jgi:hypothetical protein